MVKPASYEQINLGDAFVSANWVDHPHAVREFIEGMRSEAILKMATAVTDRDRRIAVAFGLSALRAIEALDELEQGATIHQPELAGRLVAFKAGAR